MKLMTKTLLAKLPPLLSQDGKGENAIVQAKYFTPWSNWTWYATEYDPEQRLFFGLVDGMEEELGYFGLDELEELEGPWGLKIERDLHFDPTPIADCRRASASV